MASIFDVVEKITSEAVTEKEKGTKFELTCVYFLQNDPYWASIFSRVSLLEEALKWENCPIHDTKDIGIDIVAQEKQTGAWWAIQCKCYATNSQLPKQECDSFIARAALDPSIDKLMVMTSAKAPAPNLLKEIQSFDSQQFFYLDLPKMSQTVIDWDGFINGKNTGALSTHTFDPRPHQVDAIESILKTFETHDRCKALMACGTGKTLTSLRLTEQLLNGSGTVLFCAPSISLVSQSMREWLKQARTAIAPLVVCSDSKASRLEDALPNTLNEFTYPATTNAETLAASYKQSRRANPEGLVVIFSTYQSIDVIHDAQSLGVPTFDLIICDEAHRTTGNALPGVSKSEASAFMKVHYEENIHAHKRLYMTATPRIYGETAKRKGAEDDYTIASMDDETIYGPVAYQIKFGEAVERGLLTDYKVVVLTIEEDNLKHTIAHFDNEGVGANLLDPSEIGKIVGCWKGLAEHGENSPTDPFGISDMLVVDDLSEGPALEIQPLKRAVGFCSTIAQSKAIAQSFESIVTTAKDSQDDLSDYSLDCKLRHVDGSMSSLERAQNIAWLGSDMADDTDECRILTNARCLAEGIDVPNLDAVIFFNAKNSIVDVVQAVGRVMRKAKDKHYGYIILPVFVSSGMTPEEALDDNKVFANVWSVLQALRSHDERIEAKVNALALALKTAPTSEHPEDPNLKLHAPGEGQPQQNGLAKGIIDTAIQTQLPLEYVSEFQLALHTQLVKKCGTRIYWDSWAEDVARIAERHIARLHELIDTNAEIQSSFDGLLTGLRDSLNPNISADSAIEMVAQHLITMPVFDALFGDFSFAQSNPVSIAIDTFMAGIKDSFEDVASDAEVLEDMYASVRRRASMIQTDSARQQLIKDLYEEFFSKAFKSTSEKMGIVYTPHEIVDYILRQTDRILKKEFGKSLADEGVHILDPFAGTGAFTAHLIESDVIPDEMLEHKYRYELHSNEILLLAYYIMTVNIEYAYHSRMGGNYLPFDGAVLTDTFQMSEENDTLDIDVFVENSERVLHQQELPIQVIVGNPPYSAGQNSANDNNANEKYPTLDARIEQTYVRLSESTNKNSLYDSYIRAFRWASDRIGKQGIISFVSNAGWVRTQAANGFRRSLIKEFDDIYVFDLRGNQRTQGEESRREGGKIFGAGSRAPIAVTILVKHDVNKHAGRIHYHDIGDYLTREEKLSIVRKAASSGQIEWEELTQDKYGDWLDKRDDSFYEFAPIGIEKLKNPQGVFANWSRGIETGRDSWAWSFSRYGLEKNMGDTITAYNSVIKYLEKDLKYDYMKITDKIKWTSSLISSVKNQLVSNFDTRNIYEGLYRPFVKQCIYTDSIWTHRQGQMPKLFPHPDLENIVIQMTGTSPTFSCLISNVIPDLNAMAGGSQCFPLYWYEELKATGTGLSLDFNEPTVRAGGKKYIKHEAITDATLSVFKEAYPTVFATRSKKDGGAEITKEDIFYYIYGLLHSSEYRQRFESNLMKELPHIPLAQDFAAFCTAGRALANLHLNYEHVEPWASLTETGNSEQPGRTIKMKFGKCKKSEDNPRGIDRTTLEVSEHLTLKDIPEAAYNYVVNGKSAIEWLMDRYQVKTDKATGITNDPNEYSSDPHYIVNLVKSVVTVSVKSQDIIANLPKIHELPKTANWPLTWETN